MMRMESIYWAVAIAFLTMSCAVKDDAYPRQVNTIEKGLTNVAYSLDSVGARVIPKYRIGQQYSLQRQTPVIDYSFYWNSAFKRDPGQFYIDPAGVPEIEEIATIVNNRKVRVDLLKWKSQYLPLNPQFAVHYEKYLGTHDAYAVYVRSKRVNKGCIVLAHDWTDGEVTDIWRSMGMLDYAELGYDTVLIQQPYHGLRRLPGMAFSGESFLSGDLARINEAMCQSVTDVRTMTRWMRTKYGVVGLKGTGMGGTTVLMTAVVEPGLGFVVAWSPPASLGDILQETPMAPYVLEGIRLSGLDEDTIRKTLWVSSPANYEPVIKIENVLIIAGMGDKLVPPTQINKITRKWGQPDIYWYAGGQLANFQKSRCEKKERIFLRERAPQRR